MTVTPSFSSSFASAAPTRGTPPAITREARSALSSLEISRYILRAERRRKLGDLAAEEVDVDVRRGEHDRRDATPGIEPAGVLRVDEAFHREERAHRVGEDVDARRTGPAEDTGGLLELRARHEGAVEVVDVARRPGGGGPGEEHRHPREAGVVDELGQPQDRVARRVVVAVDEEQQPALVRRPLGELRVDRPDEGRVAGGTRSDRSPRIRCAGRAAGARGVRGGPRGASPAR